MDIYLVTKSLRNTLHKASLVLTRMYGIGTPVQQARGDQQIGHPVLGSDGGMIDADSKATPEYMTLDQGSSVSDIAVLPALAPANCPTAARPGQG